MSNIKVYELREDGSFKGYLTGDIDSVFLTLSESQFTLTPPPDYDHVWRWIDDKWIADNTAE